MQTVASGTRFGRLVVSSCSRGYDGRPWTECACDCGSHATVRLKSLKNGETKSCGCLRIESAAARHMTHGQSVRGKHGETREYLAWQAMRARVTSTRPKWVKSYSSRGITVCERWRSFENFFSDMGTKPSPKHSIDRKNNDGNYEPGNCKWSTAIEQARNKRPIIGASGVPGVWPKGKRWRSTIRRGGKRVNLGCFSTKEEASAAYQRAVEQCT